MSKRVIPAKLTYDDYERILEKFDPKNEVESQEKEATKPIDELAKKWKMNDRILDLFVNNIEKDQILKEKYAKILMTILAIQLFILTLIFILRGCKLLDYSDMTFNIFITGGIAEVFILVRVIVKYLFTDNLTNALNIILKYNNQRESSNGLSNHKQKN